jgi:hypothetical protein
MGDLTIDPGAFKSVSAVLAEYVTAKALAAEGPDVLWTGGGGGMYDISAHPAYTDVKKLTPIKPSEQRRFPGYLWQIRRPKGGVFDIHNRRGEPRKTHLALIRCEPEPIFEIRDTSVGATIDIGFISIRISYVKTEIVNDWMQEWSIAAYAYLPEAGLDEHHYAEIGPNGLIRWP